MSTTHNKLTKNLGSNNERSLRLNETPTTNLITDRAIQKRKYTDVELLLRIEEMEAINSQLEELVETGRLKLNEALASNARFLTVTAHDLRNPFSTTIGILNLLKENFNDYPKAEIENLINIASNSAVRALKLLETLLEWSITQNSEQSFNPVKINLQELISEEFESFSIPADQKHITLEQHIDAGLRITADLQMVKTIFRNLISNAIKYTYSGGIVSISAIEGKRYVQITVTDNGVGISQKTQKKLFKVEEYHSTSGTNNEQGTGLGLLFCKEFIGLHGGKIWVESEPGKGSKFIFTLPHYI